MMGFGAVVYNIQQVSLRQAICPERLQGRMNASMRFLVWGTMPLGSLTGGALAVTIGLRPTLFVGAIGALLVCSSDRVLADPHAARLPGGGGRPAAAARTAASWSKRAVRAIADA